MKLRYIVVGEKYQIKPYYDHDGGGWFVCGDIVVVVSTGYVDGRVLCRLVDKSCPYGVYIHHSNLKKIK